MKTKQRIRLILLFSGIVLIGYIVFQTAHKSILYSSFGADIPKKYPVFGIDISHYQGAINFEALEQMSLENDSVQFVYIKATEGENFKDSRSSENAKGCSMYNLKYGFYHFYSPYTAATIQATFFCEIIKEYNFDLIPVIDIEEKGDLSKTALLDSINIFLNVVENNLSMRPMIYTYSSFFNTNFNGKNFNDELFWIANYNRSNPLMKKDNVVAWQFSEKGTINGINTPVDLNVAKEYFMEKVLVNP